MIFGGLTRKYFYYRKKLSGLHPKFLECPTKCALDEAKKFDARRNKFCADCDLKMHRDRFQDSVHKIWEERLGYKAKSFNFDEVLATLYSVIGSESLPSEKITVKSSQLLQTYLSEKSRFEQIEDFNSK